MNALPLPQITGLVDGSYASTTPQTVNGLLAEVRFITLGGCQTNLTLESAALAVRNESGFAAPLAGVTIGEKNIALNIDSCGILPLNPYQDHYSLDPPPPTKFPWLVGRWQSCWSLASCLALKRRTKPAAKMSAPHRLPPCIQTRPQAGKSE
jgi:hypothetical protein